MTSNKASNTFPASRKTFLLFLLVLAVPFVVLFHKSLDPSYVVFSNDGPLGGMVAQQNQMPAIMAGLWQNLNWLGNPAPSPSPTISAALRLVTSPLAYSKIFCPASLFILGVCAWFCFRQWRFSHLAAVLGGLAAALSSHFFSTACWGVAAQVICVGMNFVAVGLLGSEQRSGPRRWASVALAGAAVGMAIMEGYDIGAIFSLFVAAYGLFDILCRTSEPAKGLVNGVLSVALVAGFAAFLAAHALDTLISTQIKGVATADPGMNSPAERWDQATQWSFPPQEVLRVVIPGLFGYRMDTPKDVPFGKEFFEGGNYWGRAGETPGWTENHNNPEWAGAHPGAMPRFSGGGEYAGMLVVLAALWAIAQSFRRREVSVFSPVERRLVWFWFGAAVVSLLLAFGHYAPFYQFFYMLPYFSTIRNPAKFTHTFHFCLVILFAYGVNGMHRRYMEGAAASTRGLIDHVKTWWTKTVGFERNWTIGTVAAIIISMLGYLVYASSKPTLERRIADVGFGETASQLAAFSISSVGWYVVWLLIAAGLFTLVLSGRFAGKRAALGGVLLGAVLVLDLGRANVPWIIYQNYKQKYASNPVIDILRDKAHERRVAMLPFPAPRQLALFGEVYRYEWSQHLFHYYNIQSLDIVQNPRPPVDQVMFERAMSPTGTNDIHKITRRWELTNTRYLLGPAGFVPQLNTELDSGRSRFRVLQPFEIVPKPGVESVTKHEDLTATTNQQGPYGLIEFTGALPRASLYYQWAASTNDQSTLERLSSPEFKPEAVVLVSAQISGSSNTNLSTAPVEFVSYTPKRILMKANAAADAILLLNDKYDANWKVSVDGSPAELLRCNFIMRGVRLPAGAHEIVFEYRTSQAGLFVSLAAILIALGLAAMVCFTGIEHKPVRPEPAATVPRGGRDSANQTDVKP